MCSLILWSSGTLVLVELLPRERKKHVEMMLYSMADRDVASSGLSLIMSINTIAVARWVEMQYCQLRVSANL